MATAAKSGRERGRRSERGRGGADGVAGRERGGDGNTEGGVRGGKRYD